jgi:hypothetical protein
MAMTHLEANPVIIIFLDDEKEVADWSPVVHDQLFLPDDGPVPSGRHFSAPKIVFTNFDITKTEGHVSSTQMKTDREKAIDAVLFAIPSDPYAQPMANGQTPDQPAPAAVTTPTAPATPALDTPPATPAPAPAAPTTNTAPATSAPAAQ